MDKWWEYTLVQTLEINLAAVLLLGIFSINIVRHVNRPMYRVVNRLVYSVVNCSVIDCFQRLETTCKCISRGLAKLINRSTQ